ncbi:sigma-54 dependent transcriptional regulator [Geomonas sp. RF6]|uniref:sigma-54-dependent transcriptional regulator n=1 Tax=Geomonas sp. RF6 TaxID=2897342 RepID=UPI001E5A5066|nr:sigma-54 dependent transcriptional regulator [Geomonas sp. RF6]UFS71412.1 sigma-54 dependent transcriptional regulator [Geomonas sp. RF6]
MANILIIDDDDLMSAVLQQMVRDMGHDALCARTLREGLASVSAQPFDVVFLDVHMPDGNGLDHLPRIHDLTNAPEVIIITGSGDPQAAELAIKSGAWDYIEKGATLKEITLPLVRAIQYRQEKVEARAKGVTSLKREGIVGNSSRIAECLDLVAQAAANDSNVLITGETGTGKELFARAIHANSGRASGTFVVVDCAALPETLVEGLLFGYEKGTFTGAEKAREGLVGQANGGTLFLDEVGELPMANQKAFLRVLQERRFRPLGGSKEVESDFRLVAATNRDLDAMVQEGRFRGDLLFRLRAFTIELPPLRERHDDIKELARFQTDRLCERYGLGPKGFSPDFLSALCEYPWPGNVRELVNAMERSLASARFEPTLFSKHLPIEIRVRAARASLDHETSVGVSVPQPELPTFRQCCEDACDRAAQEYLHNLLAATSGNFAESCRISGLSRSRLYALLNKHKIKL